VVGVRFWDQSPCWDALSRPQSGSRIIVSIMASDASIPTLSTERLLLRPWRAEDRPAFAALNADPRVMAFLPKRLERAESDALAGRIAVHLQQHGFGLWAVEVRGGAPFIGFVGLEAPSFEAHFTPCLEIGWRLAFAHWGRGYATEAARRVLAHGFGPLGRAEIVSFTTRGNRRSRAVMERLAMRRDPADDFLHPALPVDHPQRPHVLYRLDRRNYLEAQSSARSGAAS
jgi:RimJ/RimL family protein N-acetyltransferase